TASGPGSGVWVWAGAGLASESSRAGGLEGRSRGWAGGSPGGTSGELRSSRSRGGVAAPAPAPAGIGAAALSSLAIGDLVVLLPDSEPGADGTSALAS